MEEALEPAMDELREVIRLDLWMGFTPASDIVEVRRDHLWCRRGSPLPSRFGDVKPAASVLRSQGTLD